MVEITWVQEDDHFEEKDQESYDLIANDSNIYDDNYDDSGDDDDDDYLLSSHLFDKGWNSWKQSST